MYMTYVNNTNVAFSKDECNAKRDTNFPERH